MDKTAADSSSFSGDRSRGARFVHVCYLAQGLSYLMEKDMVWITPELPSTATDFVVVKDKPSHKAVWTSHDTFCLVSHVIKIIYLGKGVQMACCVVPWILGCMWIPLRTARKWTFLLHMHCPDKLSFQIRTTVLGITTECRVHTSWWLWVRSVDASRGKARSTE